MIRKQLQNLRKLSGERYTIQQDGVRSHTAKSILLFLDKSVPDFNSKYDWPTNILDHSPFGYLI